MEETAITETGQPGNGSGELSEADLAEAFAGIAFGILDAVVLGPMRSEMMTMTEEDQSSSTYF
ncbi:hypothetical protein [uncultured Tateyamaria sp.]|uniref:hypothetical protein n=1 Tax=uncultured Tateyamaria sp. TaxID=455651 RepID=UPI00263A2773|nr:hypothetical protein [uncultured Tateyamaria sp.]